MKIIKLVIIIFIFYISSTSIIAQKDTDSLDYNGRMKSNSVFNHENPHLKYSSYGKIIYDTLFCISLDGNFLGDSPNRPVNIYLPPKYDENIDTRYPVVYLLHGYTLTCDSWLQGPYFFNIKELLSRLIIQQKIRPLIVVMPNSYNKYRGSWYTNSEVTGNWENYVVEELVEYIDNNYRSLAQRESRGIAGHSMGGYGAFKLAMKYPEIFSSAYTLSAAWMSFEEVIMGTMKAKLLSASKVPDEEMFDELDWNEQVMIAGAAAFAPNKNKHPFYSDFPVNLFGTKVDSIWKKWLLHDPFTMLSSYKNNLKQLDNIWIECGTLDDELYSANFSLSQELNNVGINHTWDDYVGDHSNKISERVEDKMLPFFSDVLANEITVIKEINDNIPSFINLSQNYPNPFNPVTTINYSIPSNVFTSIRLNVFDILGNKVKTLVNEPKAVGKHSVSFDASKLSSGVYYYQLKAGEFIETKKMVLMK